MRTTVTLDPDVEQLLKEAARRTRQSFKQVLNRAVRDGLRSDSRASRRRPFIIKARPLRLHAEIDPLRTGKLADDLELAAFLETTRKLRESTE